MSQLYILFIYNNQDCGIGSLETQVNKTLPRKKSLEICPTDFLTKGKKQFNRGMIFF